MKLVTIAAPASKSLSHRVCIAAALARGESLIGNVLESDDLARTRAILEALGARIEPAGTGAFRITGTGGDLRGPYGGAPLDIDVAESGTTCRLLMAVLGAGQGRFRLHGEGRMHERPVTDLAEALRSLGVNIFYEGKEGCPPLVIETRGFHPIPPHSGTDGAVVISCDESSQYLSGLLLAAPLGKNGLTILLGGSRVVSWPYVSLTLDVLERFGIAFSVEERTGAGWASASWRAPGGVLPGGLRFRIAPGQYRAGRHTVESDWSGASYFLAAGAVGPNPVCVEGVNPDSLQGDAAIQDLLARMGARLEKRNNVVTAYPSLLRGIEADMGDCPDLVPTLAAVAAHASGPTVIRGAAHLKIKESNRIEAPAAELRKVGCTVTMTDDGMIIQPPDKGPVAPEPGVIFSSHDDHRIAMSTALLGLPGVRGGKGFPVRMDNPACVSKSMPLFWKLWRQVAEPHARAVGLP